MKPAGGKNFQCNVCLRGFTRIDHLKRHHLRHSGVKPYSCVFCSEAFARCDNLRDHYTECPQRGENPIPETGQRGRRRHACESCTSMKLRCDGQSPCGSCTKRNLQCNNLVKQTTPKVEGPKPIISEEFGSPDRGSISFLLNGGTASFTEDFHLPPRSGRARGMQYHTTQNELEDAANTSDLKPEIYSELDDLTFEESLMSLRSGLLPVSQNPLPGLLTDKFPGQAMLLPDEYLGESVAGDSSSYESEGSFSNALIQAMLAKVWSVNMDATAQENISSDLHFLLTTRRICKFVSLYIHYWHRNCKVIHVPSFDLNEVPLPLLASVVYMGAMYSDHEREAHVARRTIDFAELFVYSSDLFSYEHEMSGVFVGRPTTDADHLDWPQLQTLQAALLMATTQYWAGSKLSRNRTIEARYSQIIRIARRTKLTKCRHLPEERLDEAKWIQKECAIRTMNLIALLDTAFYFYSNFPCQLTVTELECDLPCEDSVFGLQHPFTEANFRSTGEATVYEAFRGLFRDEQPVSKYGKNHHHIHSPDSYHLQQNYSGLNLTVTDMFLLIHLLHSYISSHMALQAPIMRFSHQNTPNRPSPSLSQQSIEPEDPVLANISNALSRWRTIWIDLRARIPSDEWAAMGFYKTAYNFWQLANWLITKKHSVDVMMHMEVGCEDKLEKLKVLLQDDND